MELWTQRKASRQKASRQNGKEDKANSKGISASATDILQCNFFSTDGWAAQHILKGMHLLTAIPTDGISAVDS